MSALWLTVSLWAAWVAAGITLEVCGLAGWFGLWPLTWAVRDGMRHSEFAVLGVCLVVIGFPAWLAYHFLIEPRNGPGGGSNIG